MLNDTVAVKILSALAQPTRFGVFRLLMKYNLEGLAAGEIAKKLGVPQNTLSSHLNLLANSGLIKSERQGRRLIYSVEIKAAKDFIDYLVMDCCDGHPEICHLTGNTNIKLGH